MLTLKNKFTANNVSKHLNRLTLSLVCWFSLNSIIPGLPAFSLNQPRQSSVKEPQELAVAYPADPNNDVIGGKNRILERFGIEIDLIGVELSYLFQDKIKVKMSISIAKSDSGAQDVTMLIEVFPSKQSFSPSEIFDLRQKIEQLSIKTSAGMVGLVLVSQKNTLPVSFTLELIVN